MCVFGGLIWSASDMMLPSPSFESVAPFGRLALIVLLVPLVLMLYLFVLKIVCGDTNPDPQHIFHPRLLKVMFGLLIQALCIGGVVFAFTVLQPIIRNERKLVLVPGSAQPDASGPWRILALFLAMGVSVAFDLMGILLYASLVFSEIPREWGGGAKPVVELFLTERLPVFADRKDIPSSPDGKRIGPVICILETDRILIIASLNHPDSTKQDHETIAVDRKGRDCGSLRRDLLAFVKFFIALSRFTKPDIVASPQRPKADRGAKNSSNPPSESRVSAMGGWLRQARRNFCAQPVQSVQCAQKRLCRCEATIRLFRRKACDTGCFSPIY